MSDDYFEGMAIGAAIMTIVGMWLMAAVGTVALTPQHEWMPSHKGDRLVPHYMQNVARDSYCWPHADCAVI